MDLAIYLVEVLLVCAIVAFILDRAIWRLSRREKSHLDKRAAEDPKAEKIATGREADRGPQGHGRRLEGRDIEDQEESVAISAGRQTAFASPAESSFARDDSSGEHRAHS